MTLTVNGASSYTWGINTGNVTSPTVIVTPTSNTSYVVTGATNGCTATASKNVTVNPIPIVTANSNTGTVCQGFSIALSGGGASTYSWSGGAVNNIPFAPNASAVYTVIGASVNNCTNTAVVSVTVNPSPTVTVNNGSICAGQTFTMNPSGAISYTFSGGNNVVSPGFNTSYSVTGINSIGCTNAVPAISNVTVFALPVVSVNNGVVCAGSSYTINPSGAASYTYTGGSNIVTPVNTSTYGVTGTSTAGCLSLNQTIVTVTVEALPVVSVSGGTLCSGYNFNLNPTGANTYSYLPGGSAIVSPSATTIYSVTGISPFGCLSAVPATVTISVMMSPTVSVNSGSICQGQSFTLVPIGAISYTYSGGSNVISPVATGVYSVTGINSVGCINAVPATATVIVNATPTISANSGAVCAGNSFTINPTGAANYTYSSGSNIVTPAFTSIYSIIGSSSVGCLSSSSVNITVTVNALPTLALSSGSTCSGSLFYLNPTGALTYTILPGGSATVSPSSNTTYSVVGTNSLGCQSATQAIASVTVFALPVITVNSGSICAGQLFTIVPSGASTYTIQGGNSVVSPATTSSYTLVGSSAAGCLSQNTVNVFVYPSPTISVNSGAICSGNSFTIVPSGATNYTISGGNTIVSPLTTTVYNVTGTSSLGCISSNTAVSNVTVNNIPIVTVNSGSICLGNTFTITASGAATYTVSGGNLVVNPTLTTSYSVTGTSSLGCVSSLAAISTVTVNSLPQINASSSSTTICDGETATLTASGASVYLWNTAATTSTISVSPTITTIYTVTGTDVNNCVNSVTILQDVSLCNAIGQMQETSANMRVYPNPNNGTFTISSDSEIKLTVTNELGQIVEIINLNDTNNYVASITELANGIYLIAGQNNHQTIRQKIIVSK